MQIRDIDEKGSLLSESNGGFLIYIIDIFLNTVYSALGRTVTLGPRVWDAGSLKGRRCAFFLLSHPLLLREWPQMPTAPQVRAGRNER